MELPRSIRGSFRVDTWTEVFVREARRFGGERRLKPRTSTIAFAIRIWSMWVASSSELIDLWKAVASVGK
jgi:hypothetical protein